MLRATDHLRVRFFIIMVLLVVFVCLLGATKLYPQVRGQIASLIAGFFTLKGIDYLNYIHYMPITT